MDTICTNRPSATTAFPALPAAARPCRLACAPWVSRAPLLCTTCIAHSTIPLQWRAEHLCRWSYWLLCERLSPIDRKQRSRPLRPAQTSGQYTCHACGQGGQGGQGVGVGAGVRRTGSGSRSKRRTGSGSRSKDVEAPAHNGAPKFSTGARTPERLRRRREKPVGAPESCWGLASPLSYRFLTGVFSRAAGSNALLIHNSLYHQFSSLA
jgi:hypothetical protein